MDFILCVVQYVLILLGLAAVGGAGMVVGIKMRKSSDAKNAANAKE